MKERPTGKLGSAIGAIAAEAFSQKKKLTASNLKQLNSSYQSSTSVSGYLSEEGELALVGLQKIIKKANQDANKKKDKKQGFANVVPSNVPASG